MWYWKINKRSDTLDYIENELKKSNQMLFAMLSEEEKEKLREIKQTKNEKSLKSKEPQYTDEQRENYMKILNKNEKK
jgi:hypothetical protein